MCDRSCRQRPVNYHIEDGNRVSLSVQHNLYCVSHVNLHFGEQESCFGEERYEGGPVVHQIVVELVLSCVIVEMKLALLICMIMMLRPWRFAEAEDANLLANAQSKHDGLHSGGVMKHGSVVNLTPIFRWSTCAFHEVLHGIILGNSAAEDI